ncbi:MAG: hypothetical protein WCR04_05410 [Fibrobacteraceae bacterium]
MRDKALDDTPEIPGQARNDCEASGIRARACTEPYDRAELVIYNDGERTPCVSSLLGKAWLSGAGHLE